jgi:hypothetical protein
MKIYVETPVKVEKGDFLVVDDVQDVQEKGCHCGTRKYVIQLVKKGGSLTQELDEDVLESASCYA